MELHEEVEAALEAYEPQLLNSLGLVTEENWVWSDDRKDTFELQFQLTKRNLTFAQQLQTLAITHNNSTHERVVDVVNRLISLYDIFKERYNEYNISSAEIIRGIKEKQKEKGKKTLSVELEVKFQSDVAEAYSKLTALYKKINNLASDDRIIIPTFNDVPIPLVMREQMEEAFPNIKPFLEKKKKDFEESKKQNDE